MGKKLKVNLPTKITISRIILAILLLIAVFILYYLDSYKVIDISQYNLYIDKDKNIYVNLINLIILIVFLVASLTDFLDGHLARKLNLVTDLGKFLDPLADKMLVNGMMIFTIINFSSLTSETNNHLTFPFFLVIIMIIRDLVIDALRLVGAKKQMVIAANYYGKIKTVTQMITISLYLLNGFPFSLFDYNFPRLLHIADIFAYITTFFSLLSMFVYLKDNYKVFLDDNNENN